MSGRNRQARSRRANAIAAASRRSNARRQLRRERPSNAMDTTESDRQSASTSQPQRVPTNITPKVDIRTMAPIDEGILQNRILRFGHSAVKRARQKKQTEVIFKGDGLEQQTQVVVDIRANPPADALTYPRACALAALSSLKSKDRTPLARRTNEIANQLQFDDYLLAQRCCINGARYIGRFIAQEMPKSHPAFIPTLGTHPSYGFKDGDLGEWLAAMVAMDFAKMRSCHEAQHLEIPFTEGSTTPVYQHSLEPLWDFYQSENVEPKYRKITLDAITYMGWSDGRKPVTWSELIDRECKNSVRLSVKDRNRLEQVLKGIRTNS